MKFFHKTSRKFTLIELLVAMSVFSLILLMVMQFFGGAQRLVTSSDRNNELYADARVAMDLMSSLLSQTYYSEVGDFLFYIDTPGKGGEVAQADSRLYFGTTAKSDIFENIDEANQVNFVEFLRDGDTLMFKVLMPGSGDYYKFFPPYTDTQNWADRRTSLCGILDNIESYTEKKQNSIAVIDRVVSLNFIPYKSLGTSPGFTVDQKASPPYLIEIRLSLLDKDNYETYKNLKRSEQVEFLRRNARQFSRTVFLGERWRQQ